jgi:hypothetical protein
VDTQDKILKGQVALNMNDLNPNHLDKLNTRGLLYYIIEIISDFFIKYADNNDYLINIKDLRKNFLSIVETEHKDRDAEVLRELLSKKAEGKNKCAIDRNKYTDDERFYIDKLLYTPNSNSKFEKIHKYIQGCCLRKLDSNFSDIIDLNEDVIKLKEHYSKVRLISNVRDMRFTPPKERKKDKRNVACVSSLCHSVVTKAGFATNEIYSLHLVHPPTTKAVKVNSEHTILILVFTRCSDQRILT